MECNNYAYWRTRKGNTNAFVLFHDQPIHPLFSRHYFCLRPVQTGNEALEFFRFARKALDAIDPNGVNNYLF